MIIKRIPISSQILILGFIIAGAAAVRFHGIAFGLPALFDPDEPLFVLRGLHLLHDHTLNPRWFGHPGTTTIYALGLINLLVYIFGHIIGKFPDAAAFGAAIYADPTIVFLPGRVFIALCGIATVILTFLLGRRLFGDHVGLIAAGLLAINPLHIQYSQIIRTDMHATVFMLLCMSCSVGIVLRGHLMNYLAAGMFAGLACVTKWPAAMILVAPIGACLLHARDHSMTGGQLFRKLALVGAISIVSALVASPYLILDYQTVLINLHGEARPQHLGATGSGFVVNLIWYISHPARDAVGVTGLILAAAGAIQAGIRSPIARAVLISSTIVFTIAICAQALVWPRWIIPLLPFLSLYIALAIRSIGEQIRIRAGSGSALLAEILICLVIAVPMAFTARSEAIERSNDTRSLASRWAREHVPAGSRILVEHLALDLLPQPWQFLFPAGTQGCIDGRSALTGKIQTSRVDGWRNGRAVIDVGTIDPPMLGRCRADYAILSHYDRYLAEQSRYGSEIGVYRQMLKGGTSLARFTPKRGEIGGPIVRIFHLRPGP